MYFFKVLHMILILSQVWETHCLKASLGGYYYSYFTDRKRDLASFHTNIRQILNPSTRGLMPLCWLNVKRFLQESTVSVLVTGILAYLS